MEADDRPEIGTGTGQLEHEGPAEAVPDGGDLPRVGRRFGEEHVEAGLAHGPHPVSVVPQRGRPFLGHRERRRRTAAVVVEREGDVPELCQLPSTALLVVVEPVRLVGDEHAR